MLPGKTTKDRPMTQDPRVLSARSIQLFRGLAAVLFGGVMLAAPVMAGADPDPYLPGHTVLHRIITLTVHADGTVTVLTDLARRADNEQGVVELGEDKVEFRESMTEVQAIEAWSVTPLGKRIDVPGESVRFKDADDDSEGDSDLKAVSLIYPGIEPGSTVHRIVKAREHTHPFPGHFSRQIFAIPRRRVELLEINLVHPPSVPLRVLADRFEGGRVAARVDDPAGSIRYRFTTSVQEFWPRERGELDVAAWAPSVSMSTFPDYATLAAAYHERAKPRSEPDQEIRRLAMELTREASNDRDRVARIRSWINQNIRYLSVHFGVEGWIPHPAAQVLRTRYGDCKDQVALMQAMLQALGIDATAVLINTESAYQLPRLPMATAFDHVIVYIPALDLYVDPTDRYSPLGSLSDALYGKPAVLTATGEVVQIPLTKPERDFVETTVRMVLDMEGRVRGTVKSHVGGAFESDSRVAQYAARSRSGESRINAFLRRYDEGGTGRIWGPDPLVHGEPWIVNAEFELDPVVTLPGPSAMRIPVGLTRADLRALSNSRPLAQRRNAYDCYAGRWRDDIEIELPAGATIVFVPAGVTATSGAYRYSSSWQLAGRTLKVVRELTVQLERGYCVPQDDRDFIPVREAIRRDLMAQVVFGR